MTFELARAQARVEAEIPFSTQRKYIWLSRPNCLMTLLIFQIFTKQYLAKLLYCMAWNYQAAKQKRSGVQAIAGSGTFESGMKQAAIARALNVTRGAVSQWLSAYRGKGLEALRYRKITKNPCRLSQEQKDELRKLLALGAEHFGYPGAIWTLSRVRDLNFTKIRDIVLHIQCCCHPEKNWLDLPETSSARHSTR